MIMFEQGHAHIFGKELPQRLPFAIVGGRLDRDFERPLDQNCAC